MIKTTQFGRKASLMATVAPLSILFFAAPAVAQDATPAPQPTGTAAADQNGPDIVVTGTLFRRTDTETPSPVTVLSSDDLQKRGIQTVQAGIQSLAANNGPALTNSFTANGAFAGGASAVSLRGLTTDSTLVLFDGLRAAYYPLADDGTRNFVDLNTIPDEIVDHIDVLKDGASSTYGADAVAGVVNIVTKKQITGIHATAEAGISQEGDAANHRLSLTAGYGDLDQQGFNIYVSGHYVDSDALYARDRSYPYNTDDQSGICSNGVCGPNLTANGVDPSIGFTGLSTAPDVFLVRPYDAANTTAQGRYQLLNGCGNLQSYTLTDAEYNAPANASAPRTVCQQDITRDYGQIEPVERRWGASAHATVKVGGNSELTAEFNYEQNYTAYTGLASTIRANAPAGIDFPAFSTSATTLAYGNTILTLPVYVCPRGTTAACTAANGTLNPNNPFAAQNEVARIIGRLPTSTEFNSTLSQVYRGALSLHGSFGDSWNYSLDGTAMISKLRTTAKGYVYIQHLLDEINDGSYNFVNPELNSQATLDYLAPTQINHQSSHLYQVQGSLAKDLFQLPGGPLQVAVGAAYRHESLNDPSGNPDFNGPTERYFRLNAFGAEGQRDVESAYFEINAPVFDKLELNGSGRYDHYSSGQSNFSPKIGAKFTPIKQLALRATFSKGFRIPSFAESNALPTTGYVTQSVANIPDSFVQQHLNAAGTGPNTYLTSYSIGETTVGNPNLKPEKSTNFTVGAIFEPIRHLSFTVDYYNIKKTNAITTVDFSGAIANYYATGQTSFNGVTVIPDAVDVDHPTSLARIQLEQGSFINANTIKTSGIDFGVQATVPLWGNVKFETSGEADYIFNLDTEFPDGSVQHYAGTLGNFNLTSGSGTQRWKANWQNTLDFGNWSVTGTAYYTSGYNYSAEDQEGAGTSGDCGLVPTNFNGDAYQPCNVKSFIDVDLNTTFKIDKKFTFYVNVINLFNAHAPIDATTYGAYLYNPTVGDAGILGRMFRVGAKVDF